MILSHLYLKLKPLLECLLLLIITTLPYSTSAGNSKSPSLIGNWIKVGITYLDGSPLEDHHALKYSFLKYSFKSGNEAAIITDFLSGGEFSPYEQKNGTIEISTKYGVKIKLRTAYLSQDSLVVIQEGPLGRRDPSSLSITFVRYDHLQKISKWNSQDYVLTSSKDTVYKASQKIHPVFSNPNGLKYSLQQNMRSYEKHMQHPDGSNGLFFASFIVTKSGTVEDIRIIQGLDDKFNKEFLAACKKTEKKWTPAYYNKKPVDTQVTLEINFDFLNQFLSNQTYIDYAVRQLEKGNITGAIAYFDKMISINPKNERALILRGQCYVRLNDLKSACEDFRILKSLGFASGTSLLEKHCK